MEKGQHLRLLIVESATKKPIAYATGLQFHLSATTEDSTTKDSSDTGLWNEYDVTQRNGDIQIDALIGIGTDAAAKLLEQRFGTPYEFLDPRFADGAQDAWLVPNSVANKRVLVVHQQVTAHSLRQLLLAHGAQSVTCATWFMQLPELTQPGDAHLAEEDDFAQLVTEGAFDAIIGDPALWPIIPQFEGELIDLPHFALSGTLIKGTATLDGAR